MRYRMSAWEENDGNITIIIESKNDEYMCYERSNIKDIFLDTDTANMWNSLNKRSRTYDSVRESAISLNIYLIFENIYDEISYANFEYFVKEVKRMLMCVPWYDGGEK